MDHSSVLDCPDELQEDDMIRQVWTYKVTNRLFPSLELAGKGVLKKLDDMFLFHRGGLLFDQAPGYANASNPVHACRPLWIYSDEARSTDS